MITGQEFINDLKAKRTLASIYVVVGQEQYLIRQIKKTLINLIPPEEQQLNIGQYDMEEVSLTTALEDALTLPFFGEKRLVLIENAYFLTGETKKGKIEHDLGALEQYLMAPEVTSSVVFFVPAEKLDKRKKVVKLLLKNAIIVDNAPLDEKQIKNYLNKYLAGTSFQFQPAACEALILRTNANLALIMNELKKLMIAKKDDKLITLKDVEELVAVALEQDVFNLITLVLRKDFGKALNFYQELLLQKNEPLKLNALLVSQFRLLLQVKILHQKGYLQGTIVQELKVHPYRVQLALKQVQKFSLFNLQAAYLGLIKAEEKLKSTPQAPEMIFEMFLFEYCNPD